MMMHNLHVLKEWFKLLKTNNMKGKIIKTDKEWMVEIQSDLHGYGIGWGDPMIYPLFITDENIWEGKEVEVEPIQYDSNFLPVIVKIKTNNMKPKTFEELFAGSGIEPTKDENGGVHYNFNATLKNKPMKLYAEEQLQEAYNRGLMDGRLNNVDYSIPDGFTPIELPSDEEIEQEAYYKVSDHTENPYASFKSGAKWMKEQILNQKK
jgi:hypothetical protein